MSLLVIVPTRRHVSDVEQFIKSFDETTDQAELLFITDDDDDSYEGFDWKGHTTAAMTPRGCLSEKLNFAAAQMINSYDHLMYTADDSVFVTEHWDTKLLDVLDTRLNGSGLVYPNNQRRMDVPESWLVSVDVLRQVGWFANPLLKAYFIDNSWGDICKRADCIRFVPDVIVDRRHSQPDVEAEQLYALADQQTYLNGWRGGNEVAMLVSRLRRNIHPDVKWVLSKI